MRVVLDTNVWISALLNPAGPSGRLVGLLVAGDLAVFSTRHLWDELRETLAYERIQRALERHGRSTLAEELMQRLEGAVAFEESVEPAARWVPEDPDDDWVVQCAVSARVALIITGDAKLLGLERVEGIEVASPSAALMRLAEKTVGG